MDKKELEICLNISIECDSRAKHKSQLKELLGLRSVAIAKNLLTHEQPIYSWNSAYNNSFDSDQLSLSNEIVVDFLLEVEEN